MPTTIKPPLLTSDKLARLFLQLTHLEKAGLPAAEAFAMIAKNDPLLRKPLKTMPSRLRKGQKIAEAGYKTGLFDDNQRILVTAGENSGKLAAVYTKLADFYGNDARRRKKMRSRLYLPAFVLILAFFVQPLPALVTAQITLGRYLFDSAGQLLLMATGIALLVKFPSFLTSSQAALLHRWQLAFPPVANWVVERQLNSFYFMLAMMLDAGLAYSAALPQAVASIKNTGLRKQFDPALALMKSGASVGESLATVGSITASTLQIINTGEHSGQLADTLLHFTQIDAQTLALQDEAFAEWLPRLVYTAIGLWIAYGILQQGLPSLPAIQ
ncbi:MAG: type II secretion system F family protein [Methylovulum sp.]|uniref:type II secretion system F family protein n=1 Tax=Methylovulum sp. TaxID=1916980 RepID=UPI0026317C38|nr:type II secretion system F family protein [Methylovulum sp.]MDD2724708.1 type II secretion system F family protein [Methylovulum sp.]MDD5124667.1 type II secretion system F family protein [Methylovulum sp.]